MDRRDYTDRVLSSLRRVTEKEREAIRSELDGHIEDHMEALRELGYQKVQLSLALELPTPDLIVAEGGTLTQCSAISKMFGKRRCLAHLHGQTSCSHEMDAIYGGILALSEFIRDDYLKTSELDRKHAYILHNCIDTARFVPGPADAALRASLGFAPEDFVVLFCGRLEPDKGIHKLLEAMENIHDPRIKLLIVGSPFFGRTQQSPFLRKLEQQAETLGDRVRFTGYVPNDSMPEYYRLADLVCVPTLVEEAAGLVAVEAMGCGRPVLATRSGGMPEYLDGSQAVLVDRDGNVAGQLSFAIRMLYEHPDLRAQMSTAGAKTAQRVILELKDKLSLEEAFELKSEHVSRQNENGSSGVKNEAVQALVALGYASSEALKALNGIEITDDMDVETLLKAALKNMAFL